MCFDEELLLRRAGERVPDLVRCLRAVQEQGRAVGRAVEHLGPVEQPELVATDEARLPDQVRRADRLWPETQVRDRLRTRLLRVVDEVPLSVEPLGAEDLDRVLVRADRAVRAQPEEDCADRPGWLDVQRRVVVQARPRDVVRDADGETAARLIALQLVEDAGDHARGELLRGEPVTAADDRRHRLAGTRLAQRRHRVEEERLAEGARLLRPVEDCDPTDARRERVDQRLRGERPVEPHAAPRRRAPRFRSGARPSHRRSPRPIPSAPERARPPDARGSPRSRSGVPCARRDRPSSPRPRREHARRRGSPSRAPGSTCPGSATFRA